MHEVKPSCFDCIHSQYIAGSPQTQYDPGEPDRAECNNSQIEKEWKSKYEKIFEYEDFQEDLLPEKCNNFEPKMIEECSICNKTINMPEYKWYTYVYNFESDLVLPACSDDCKNAYDIIEKLTTENQ